MPKRVGYPITGPSAIVGGLVGHAGLSGLEEVTGPRIGGRYVFP